MRATVCVETQQGATYDDLLTMARAAEAGGFEALLLSDHYLEMPWKARGTGGLPGPTDAWTTLAGLGRETTTIRLGTLVSSATFRQPVPLAITVAQVDAMTGGRAVLGLGAGWFPDEHAAQGIPFPPLAERFDRLAEQLEIITTFWATPAGARFDYSGSHYHLVGSPGLPKPIQQPGPPIIIGGSGKRRTPHLAARFAAEYNSPFVSPVEAKHLFDRVRHACEAICRDPDTLRLSSGVIMCCGATPTDVARRCAAYGVDPSEPPDGLVCGSPQTVASRLGEWGDAGADIVHLEVDSADADQIELLAGEVLPLLR